jgi:glycosyltransferase involved in cell wall biosynthesis
VEAVVRLVDAIFPRVRRRLSGPVRLVIVGPHDGRVERLRRPGVELTGFVADLGPVYAAADVVVVPLSRAAGTRIKLLEAFANGVPVVASTAAGAGLEVADGRELLIADDDERFAAAVERILHDRALRARVADAAATLVRERHSIDAVAPLIEAFFARAAARARRRPLVSASSAPS